eukprot:scaffold557082_cov45-Prasinocladus_malaysianus.AAC.1
MRRGMMRSDWRCHVRQTGRRGVASFTPPLGRASMQAQRRAKKAAATSDSEADELEAALDG